VIIEVEGNDPQLRDCLKFTLPLCRFRGSSAEPGVVQRAKRNVSKRACIHQNGAAWSFYCSLYPLALKACLVRCETFITDRSCVGMGLKLNQRQLEL